MKAFNQEVFEGERALYNVKDVKIDSCTFENGESPLKECENIEINSSIFKWKYPLWYSSDIKVKNSILLDTARSGIWYTENISMTDCFIEAPKTFRRAEKIYLENLGGTKKSREVISNELSLKYGELSGFIQQYLFYYKRTIEKTAF